MRGKESFSGRSHFGWSRNSLFFSRTMRKEMSSFLKMKKGCTCSGDVTRVAWGQNKTTHSATLAYQSVPGLYFALLLLIYHLQLLGPGSGGCLHPNSRCVRTWREAWLSHNPRAARPSSSVSRTGCGCLALHVQTLIWEHRYLKTISLREKVSLFFLL